MQELLRNNLVPRRFYSYYLFAVEWDKSLVPDDEEQDEAVAPSGRIH